jgi:hypothetical protein
MQGRRSAARPGRRLPVGVRVLAVGACTLFATAMVSVPVAADEGDPPVNAVSSTGGVANASADTSVQTGDIVTGMNTGHSVETGGTSQGDLIVTVAEMSSESNLEVIAEVGPQIADASGGDEGDAQATPGSHPNFNVNIDNKDTNRNRSSATGIGEGGAGGAGGSGGDVTVTAPAP